MPPLRESMDNPPMNNPYLQNGPDTEGVAGALIDHGTDMMGGVPGSEMNSMTTDAAAF
jgi:hypothetical protein